MTTTMKVIPKQENVIRWLNAEGLEELFSVCQLGPRVRFPWPLIVLEIFMQFSSQKLHRRSPATSFWKERSEAQISNIFIGPEIFFLRSHWSTWDASTPAMFTPLLLTRSFKVSDTQVKAFFFKLFCFSWTQAWTRDKKYFLEYVGCPTCWLSFNVSVPF